MNHTGVWSGRPRRHAARRAELEAAVVWHRVILPAGPGASSRAPDGSTAYAARMGARRELDGLPARFRAAVEQVRAARMRAEVLLNDVPAPQRIAPFATALGADVSMNGDEIATGRLVLLHDPDGNDSWDGRWRCVTFVRAEVDPEMVRDPLLSGVAWSWLDDAWQARNLVIAAPSGTVTAVLSEGFGGIESDGLSAQVEVRASWTSRGRRRRGSDAIPDIRAHVEAWGDLLCCAAGLPPVPAGVVPLPARPTTTRAQRSGPTA